MSVCMSKATPMSAPIFSILALYVYYPFLDKGGSFLLYGHFMN